MTTGSLILDFAIIIAICAFTVIITRRPKPLPMNQKTKITLSSMAILTPGINLSGTSFFDPLMLPGKHELFGFPIPQLGFITYTILSLLFSAQYFKSNLTPLYNSGVFITLIATTFLAVKSQLEEGTYPYCALIWLNTIGLFIVTSYMTTSTNKEVSL